jgi:hypothetical protein
LAEILVQSKYGGCGGDRGDKWAASGTAAIQS